MSRSVHLSAPRVAVVTAAALLASAVAVHAYLSTVTINKCLAGKAKTIGKAAAAYTKCYSKNSAAPDAAKFSACTEKASLKTTTAFSKLDAKYPGLCPGGNGDGTSQDSAAATFGNDANAAAGNALGKCDAAKQKCIGKYVAAIEKCYAKAAVKTGVVDNATGGCTDKAAFKLVNGTNGCLDKAAAAGDCTHAGTQASTLRGLGDAFIQNKSCVLDPTNPGCGGCSCCSGLPRHLAFTVTGPSGGPTGSLSPATCHDGTSCTNDSNCSLDGSACIGPLQGGMLYSGSGNGGVLPRAVPATSPFYFNVASCNAGNPVLTPTTSAEAASLGDVCPTAPNSPTWGERHCTSPGCYLGVPVQVTNTADSPICGVNRIANLPGVGTGSLTCTTGEMNVLLPLEKTTYGQACPTCAGGTVGVCLSGTCSAGPNFGAACTPETASGESQDCPPGTGFAALVMIDDGTLSTGTISANAFSMGAFTNTFCGFCSNTGSACTSNGDCSPGTCVSSGNGAFGRLAATSMTESGTTPNECVALGAHAVTLANLSCVPGTTSGAVNNVAGLPGPAAVSVRGSVQLIP